MPDELPTVANAKNRTGHHSLFNSSLQIGIKTFHNATLSM
jgi:hypothetical protein